MHLIIPTYPDAGSAWMALSRSLVEYSIWGWDNLPRTVLMYYSNFISSPEGYFHTVVCNAEEFKNTTVNHDLHYISWDNPPKQHPHYLTLDDLDRMIASDAPFAPVPPRRPGRAHARRLVRGDRGQRERPLLGRREHQLSSAWPRGCAAAAARHIAPVRGEVPPAAVQVMMCF